MYHLISGAAFDAFMAALLVGLGYAGIAPAVDRMPPVRLRLLAALWAALILGIPAVWVCLDGSSGETRHSYLYELGHSWPACMPILSGLLVSCPRRWRRRVR